MTKEAANREMTIVLAGLLTQAELPLLVFPLEFSAVTEGEGEELDTEDGDDGETGEERVEEDGLREEGTSCMIKTLGPGVFEGGVSSGTEVGLVGGVETEDE